MAALEDLDSIVSAALAEFSACGDPAALENSKARFLGKNGHLTELLKSLRKLAAEERPAAGARINQAKAALEGARADLDKTVVKAPVDGAILKVNVRLGEYAQAGVLSNPLMTMGSVYPLHVRVDIDEADSWRVHPDSPAIARCSRSGMVRYVESITGIKSLRTTSPKALKPPKPPLTPLPFPGGSAGAPAFVA